MVIGEEYEVHEALFNQRHIIYVCNMKRTEKL